MHILKSVGVLSVAKILGIIYGCMGLLFAPVFLLFGLAGSIAQDRNPFAGIVGVVLAIFMPIIYGVMGFVIGAVGGLLYNLLARWIGGVEFDLELRPQTLTAPYPIIPPIAATPNS